MEVIQLFYEVDGRPQVYSLLKEEVSIGRSSENDVVLNDFSVSRKHAIITRENDSWVLRDNQSTNGVKVNGKAVSQAVLQDGDELSVGTFTLTLRDDPSIASRPRPSKKDSTSTFIRPLSEFNEDFGLEKTSLSVTADSTIGRKRGVLDLAYKNKVFEILVQVAKTLISADELAAVLEKVMDLIFEYLPADRGFLLLIDENGELRTRVARFKSQRLTEIGDSESPFSRTIVDMVVRQKVAFLTSDAQSDERVDLGQSIRIQQIRSAMCVPLWDRGTVIGVIHVDSPIHVGTFTSEDLDLLTALGNFAAVAIERASLHDRIEADKRIRMRLERYHSPAVIDEIIADSAATGSLQRARTKEVTVLFADLVGFTAMSEKMAPDAISAMLSTFFTHAAEIVFSLDGTLDKFIGDEAMAFFGAPIDQPDHAWRGVMAGIKIRDAVAEWNRLREKEGEKPIAVRVAINSGEVVVGEIGSENRVDYTVLGTPVNLAARIEQSVASAGEVVIGPSTHEAIRGRFQTAQMGSYALKGLAEKVPLYRVVSVVDSDSAARPTLSAEPREDVGT